MKIFVGNFSFSTTEDDLRSLFSPFGNIDTISVITDRTTGRSRGFGFVEMGDRGQAEKAIEALNGKDFGGRSLSINEARPKTEAAAAHAVHVRAAVVVAAAAVTIIPVTHASPGSHGGRSNGVERHSAQNA